jgi:hypothetical protein
MVVFMAGVMFVFIMPVFVVVSGFMFVSVFVTVFMFVFMFVFATMPGFVFSFAAARVFRSQNILRHFLRDGEQFKAVQGIPGFRKNNRAGIEFPDLAEGPRQGRIVGAQILRRA